MTDQPKEVPDANLDLVGHLRATSISRPCLEIEEVKQDDGSFKAGRQTMSAIVFKPDNVDMWGYLDKVFAEFTLTFQGESWKLFHARIAPMPQKVIGKSENLYVVISERTTRV